jgi:hypothetical protein
MALKDIVFYNNISALLQMPTINLPSLLALETMFQESFPDHLLIKKKGVGSLADHSPKTKTKRVEEVNCRPTLPSLLNYVSISLKQKEID